MTETKWDIHREGRAWKSGEALDRFYMAPRKTEMVRGKLFDTEEERLTLLALLLENVGVDQAIRLGDSAVWREAIAAMKS